MPTVCKLCVMQKGLKGKDLFEGKCDYAFETDEEFMNHLKKIHNINVIGEDGKQIN